MAMILQSQATANEFAIHATYYHVLEPALTGDELVIRTFTRNRGRDLTCPGDEHHLFPLSHKTCIFTTLPPTLSTDFFSAE